MHLYVSVADIVSIGLATKGLRILSLGGTDKTRSHLVTNPIHSRIPNMLIVASPIFGWQKSFWSGRVTRIRVTLIQVLAKDRRKYLKRYSTGSNETIELL